MLKIFIKYFSQDSQYTNDNHSKIVNSIEYILPCINEKYMLVNNTIDADVILASIYTSGYNEFIKFYNENLNKKIIIGGYHPSICPEDFIHLKNVVIVIGGGESVINEALYTNKKILHGNPIDVIPERMSYSKIVRLEQEKIINIRTYYGCRLSCEYCCHPLVFPKIFHFGISNIITDIEKHKPTMLFITDSDFSQSLIFEELHNYCNKKNIKLRYYLTVNNLNDKLCNIINNSIGDEIIVGLEKNITKKSYELFKNLKCSKIGCIIKTLTNEDEIKTIKQKYNFVNNFSEMWMMPFPKTKTYTKYINKVKYDYSDYDYLTPRKSKFLLEKYGK